VQDDRSRRDCVVAVVVSAIVPVSLARIVAVVAVVLILISPTVVFPAAISMVVIAVVVVAVIVSQGCGCAHRESDGCACQEENVLHDVDPCMVKLISACSRTIPSFGGRSYMFSSALLVIA